jgi:hypothetical protein
MHKAILFKLPLPKRITPLNGYKYTLEAEVMEVKGDKLLVINAYFKNNMELNYRIFISNTQYTTLDCQTDEKRWRDGRLINYVSFNWWNEDKLQVFVEKKHHKLITNYLGVQDVNIMNAITRYQDKILSAKILEAEKRITDPIDKRMESINDLPKDFDEWLLQDVFLQSRYIYYQYEKKVNMKGYCTHCKNNVQVYKPKHNEQGICPECGSKIFYKAIGKSKYVEDERKVAVFQKTEEGFVIRFFEIRKCYYKAGDYGYKDPQTYIREIYRDFYDTCLNQDTYNYSMFKNKYMRWNKCDMHYKSAYHVYPNNVFQCIKDTKLKYSELQKLAGNKLDFKFQIDEFIRRYKEGDIYLEHFIKVGLYNLTRSILYTYKGDDFRKEINEKGKNLNAVLGIENDDIKILMEADVSYSGLSLFKKIRNTGKRLNAEQLKEIVENYNESKMDKIFKYAPIFRALKYLRNQPSYVSDPETIYGDYLESCIKLNQDIKNSFVLFPKDLRTAHDINVEIINEKSNKKIYASHNNKYSKIRKLQKKLDELYFFEDDQFLIRAPIDAAEIVKEGQSLHHCVGGGGYSERMAKGEIAILFLRDKQALDIPYYTLEVNRKDNTVWQVHGYKNKDKDIKRIHTFINKFKKNILQKLNERKAG